MDYLEVGGSLLPTVNPLPFRLRVIMICEWLDRLHLGGFPCRFDTSEGFG